MQSELNTPGENVSAAIRIAALFVLLAGGVWITTQILVRRADANFTTHSATHVGNEVRRIRGDITATEAALDAAITRVSQRLAAKPNASRPETFAMLRHAVIERQPSATLWIDVMPRPKSEVVDVTRSAGENLASALLVIGAIAVLVLIRNRSIIAIGLIVVARVALLPVRVEGDASRIFTFDIYASRILGPFSRSPFDLLMTAAAVLGIAVVLTRRRSASANSTLMQIARAVIALLAGYGFVVLIGNLVDNSRVSAVPDHIVPLSLAQGVLLSALMLFGFALLQITRHEAPLGRALVAAAVVIVPALLAGYALGSVAGPGFLSIAAAVVISLLVPAVTRSMTP